MANPGNLVEYIHNKKLVCALILAADRKEQVHVRNEDNREDRVARSKLVFVTSESFAPDSDTSAIHQWLRQAAQRRDEWSRSIALQELWELTVEEGATFSLDDLASLQWSQPSSEQLSGLYRALEQDKLFFSRKGSDYQPRTPEHIQETRARLQAEEEKARERELLSRWLKALWDERPLPELENFEKTQNRYLTWIREVALFGSEAPRFKDVQGLLRELDINGKDAPFRLLVKAGLWGVDEFLSLHRLHPPIEFSPELHAEAEACRVRLQQGLEDESRTDLTHLPAVTIDDEWTSEVDDALTLERLPEGGYRVGVHIADASWFVQPGTPLDEEALERGTAIYLPERKIRMVPDVLGDDLCSLISGCPRLAFTFSVQLDSDLQVVSSAMFPSRIQVSERLTYDEADARIQSGEGMLADLYRIALALRSVRQSRGAVTLPFPRTNIRVELGADEPQIMIQRDKAEVPGQVLVSEMMILANRLSGEYFAAHSIPALFRSQPEPEKPIPPDVDTAPESLHKLRRLMKKGEVGLSPARHAGLGLDAYSQATSPIRRYVDLISQRQLKAHLKGEAPPYTQEALVPMMQRLERTSGQAEQLERERKQYWTLRYLEQRRWAELDAVVLQNLPDKHIVQIVPILYETDCPLVPRRPLPPGTRLKVRIELAWPREGTLRVTPVLDDLDDE